MTETATSGRAQPGRRGGLKRDMTAIAIGHGAYALGQWAIAAAIAKLAGVEAMATFGLALAIGGPVYFFANMALRTALARDAGREFAFGDYRRARRATTLSAGLFMVLAALTFGAERGFDGALALLLFAAIKSVDASFDLIYGRRQRDGEARKVAVSFVMRSLFGPAACVLGLLASDGALWAGLGAWAAAAAGLYLAREKPGLAPALAAEPARPGGGRAVLARAWPLGVAAALAALETAIPRYAIEGMLAADALGYFTGVFFFFQAAIVVAVAFGSAAAPHLGRAYAMGDRARFQRMTLSLAMFGLALGLVVTTLAWLLGPWALALAYTDAYAAYGDVLTVTMAAAGLRFAAAFLQFALVASGRFKTYMNVHIVLMALTLIAAFPLVEAHGLLGAAVCLAVVAAAQLLLTAALAWRAARAIPTGEPTP